MDTPEIISLIFTILGALCIAIIVASSLLGLRWSWKHSLIKLGRTVVAIALAFAGAKLILELLPISELLSPLVSAYIGETGEFYEFIQSSPTLYAFICNLPMAFVMPSLFISFFFLFNALLGIPTIFIKKAVLRSENRAAHEAKKAKKALKKAKKLEKKALKAQKSGKEADLPEYNEEELKKTIKEGKISWGSRFISAGIKAANTFIFLALLILPISCIITTVGQGIISVKNEMVSSNASIQLDENDPNSVFDGESLSKICDDYISPVVEAPVVVVGANPLSRAMFASLTEVHVGNTRCSLDREISDIFTLLGNATHLLVAPEDYSAEQKIAFADIIGYIADSEFRCTLSSELFSAVAGKWQNGEAFFGIPSPATEDLEIIFDPLLEILATSTPESVGNDLHTFSNILGILIDYDMFDTVAGTLSSDDPIAGVRDLASSEFLNDVLTEIYSNEDYKVMTQPVVRFAFNALLASLNAEQMGPSDAAAPDFTKDEIRAEADAICSMILSAVDFIESLPEDDTSDIMTMITEIKMGSLGKFYDDSQHSKILSEGFHDTFVAVLNSEMLDSMRGVCNILVDHINNDPELNMENLLLATQELATIFVQYQGGAYATDTAKLSSTLGSLVKKVDAHTAEIIKDFLKDDAFKMDMLGGEENSSQVTKLLTSVIDSMAELDDLTEEELEKETKALDYVLKIVNTTSGSSSEGGEGGTTIESIFKGEEDNPKEMIDTMLNSKLVTNAITAVAYDEETGELSEDALALSGSVSEKDKDSVIESAEEYYKETVVDMTEEEIETLKTNMNALASIFGEDLTDRFAEWDLTING